MPKKTWTDKQLKVAVKKSQSIGEVLFNLNLRPSGSSHKNIKLRIEFLNLSTTHFLPITQRLGNLTVKNSLKDILVENSKFKNSGHLKNRLIKENVLVEVCYICKHPPIWNNKRLVLQLDHINGIKTDNRRNNLRLLCPNCHTQTETFGCKRFKQK